MKSSVLLGWTAMAGMAIAAGDPNGGVKTAPVLRKLEPEDSVVFRLPGPRPVAPAVFKTEPAAVAPQPSPMPSRLVAGTLPLFPSVPKPVKPASPPRKPALPPEAVRDLAAYLQKGIGMWQEPDVRQLLGESRRHRPAFDERKRMNGRIYAFNDPTHRYRELELDFDQRGALRTVFVYPPRLTWQEAHRRWTGEVSVVDARQGRKFYSYLHRRMDVLVDSEGIVISLGLY